MKKTLQLYVAMAVWYAAFGLIPNVTILLMYSSEGFEQWGISADIVGPRWQQHLTERFENDPQWPFQATVELMDIKSNATLIEEMLPARLANQSLPNVTVVLGPEDILGPIAAPFIAAYGIANILTSTNPDPMDITPPNGTETTFYIEAPAQYTFRTMIDTYVQVGVKSLAIVTTSTDYDSYNYNTCIYTGRTLAAPVGIDVYEFVFEVDFSEGEMMDIVKAIRDINPDAVFWCDWQGQSSEENIYRFPLPMFKEIDYLPKAFTMLDIFDSTNYTVGAYQMTGLLDYIGEGSFININLKGQDYTEENRPYSNVFRPTNPIRSVADELICGTTAASPSSVKLFNDWFLNETGAYPIYQTNGLWAAFDIIEAALYDASHVGEFLSDGVLAGNEVLPFFYGAQTSGPYGRVIFDGRRVNTPTPTIFEQLVPSYSMILPAVVGPSGQMVHPFVYPMPGWGEREYRWSLFKSKQYIYGAIGIAAGCTTLLLSMAITIIVFRKDAPVRMLDYMHMTVVCVLSCVVCWALVFLWQDDMTSLQCRSYVWVVYLPLSFIVNLMNMKAYRLSLFIRMDVAPAVKRSFGHMAVLKWASIFTFITAALLLAAALGDPMLSVETVVDPYRPSLNYHTCQSRSGATPGILWLIVILHFIMSGVCVNRVRNGFEAFRDGMLMKEAYLLLYGSMLITLVIQNLGLGPSLQTIARTALLSAGITGFCARLLLSRCSPHWTPTFVAKWETLLAAEVKRLLQRALILSTFQPPSLGAAPSSVMYRSSINDLENGHGEHSSQEEFGSINESSTNNDATAAASSKKKKPSPESAGDEGPLYKQDAPTDTSIADMLKVITDPARGRIFRSVAEKALIMENVNFLQAVLNYQSKAEEILLKASADANAEIRQLASSIHEQFLKLGASEEVNVSSSARKAAEKKLVEWIGNVPLLSPEEAKAALNKDRHQGKTQLFDRTMKEISVLLHQNIWNKFRAAETTAQMALASKSKSSIGFRVVPGLSTAQQGQGQPNKPQVSLVLSDHEEK